MTLQAPSAHRATEPRVIAQKYRLESLLGEGGMGSVWRAFNLQLEVPVAIKLLRPDLPSAELGERLRVEARAGAKLVHPSIVRVFDIGEAESGDPFIVMELLSGESLGSLLERGPLPAVDALQLLLPIAEGLSLAHSRGVVHRDLKPDNIFLATDGNALQPKLLDFGIAKVTSTVVTGGAVQTQTGTLLGSPDYMSPEQAFGRNDIDPRSDVWSFCAMLYEALSGNPPFVGDSCQQVLRSVVQDEPVPLDEACGVDPELSRLVMRGLTKDRELRPGSIFELGQELAGWLMAQGVLEDATGSSLEAKWFGRNHEGQTGGSPRVHVLPRAQHDHATLVSVAHPSPPSERGIELPLVRARKRSRTPVAVACALALTAGGVGITWREVTRGWPGWSSTMSAAVADAPRAAAASLGVPESLPPPPPKLKAPELPPVAEPLAVAAMETNENENERIQETPAPARRAAPPTAPKQLNASTLTAAMPKGETPVRDALPEALPVRQAHSSDLLNPY